MMKNHYLDHEPSRKLLRLRKRGLDRIKARLDRIRAEQSEIYTHFKKKYNRHQIENIVTEEQMQDLQNEVHEATSISNALRHIEMGRGRRFSY